MLRKGRHAIEKILRTRGFTSPESRRIMANQIVLALAALAIGVLTSRLTLWPLAFAVGAVLATTNLWQIAKSAHWSVAQRFTPVLALAYFGGFLLRFAGIGIAAYAVLVWLKFPLVPFLAGLFSVVGHLSLMGISRIAGNSCKEA